MVDTLEEKEVALSVQTSSMIDTKISKLDDILVEALDHAFCQDSDEERQREIGLIVNANSATDLGTVVVHSPVAFRYDIYEALGDVEDRVEFLINTNRITRRAVFKKILDNDIKDLVKHMPPDEAVSLLEELPERRFKLIMDILDEDNAEHIRELNQYDFNTAGRIMTNEFFEFSRNTTIGEAAMYIRNYPKIDFLHSVFVLDEEDNLEGYVLVRNLLINHTSIKLSQLMRPVIHSVGPEASRNEIIDLVERYKIAVLPVLSSDSKMLGIITNDDVVEIMEEVADETIAQIAGTGEDVSEHEPLIRRFLWRAPWLLVTLCGGLLIAATLSSFQHRIWYAIASFFVPLITGMSGNVGIQCSTVLVRSIATGELTMGNRRAAVIKELTLGLCTGVVFGALGAIVIYGLHMFGVNLAGGEPLIVATIVGMGILGACLTSSCLGVYLPFFFARLSVDPAVASGPIVTALNDVISTAMFCAIARIVSSFVY